MKKIYLSFVIIVLVSSMAHAQSVSFGLRGGINIAKATVSGGSGSVSTDSEVGLQLGTYATFMISDDFGLQPELVYSQYGGSSTFNGTKSTGTFGYLSIPLMARYNVSENFSLQAGPQLGFLLSATSKAGSGNSVDIKDAYNTVDLGGAVGFGVDFGSFNAGARYYFGLSNIAKDVPTGSDLTIKNSAFQLFVGYTLFKK